MHVNYLAGTPHPPNLIAVDWGSIKFLCHGRLLVGLYLGCRRGSFRAAVDHCRSFRLLITTFVSITPRGFTVCYICYEIGHLLY